MTKNPQNKIVKVAKKRSKRCLADILGYISKYK